jgi:hypothetical protein
MVVSFAITNIRRQLLSTKSMQASVPPLYHGVHQHSGDLLPLPLRGQLPMKPQPAVVQFSAKLTHPASCDVVPASDLHRPFPLAQPQNDIAIALWQRF